MSASRRVNRIHIPSIEVTFRGQVALEVLDVWREDRLVSGEGDNVATYTVLDFGVEERVDFMHADIDEADRDWRATGRVLVELQRIDPDTGVGRSNPSFKEFAGEDGAVSTWIGWKLIPCSPRRPTSQPAPEPGEIVAEQCLMCGSLDVCYHDADGSPRCASHVGESPDYCLICGSADVVAYAEIDGTPRCADHLAAPSPPEPEPETCTCGKQAMLGASGVEIGGTYHRADGPCYRVEEGTVPASLVDTPDDKPGAEIERTLISEDDMGEYVIRRELWTYHPQEAPQEMTSAYTKSGSYIGNPDDAAFLASEGIVPELRTATSNVCSIGYNALEQRWYGWSHRARFGFAVGDVVDVGDVLALMAGWEPGHVIQTIDEAKAAACAFAESVS